MMILMKHLMYDHQTNRALVETLGTAVRRVLPGPLRSPEVRGGQVSIRSRVLVGVGWVITLAIQAALLVLIAELVEVAHGVMSLYLDLAEQQIELTHLYVAATTPQ